MTKNFLEKAYINIANDLYDPFRGEKYFDMLSVLHVQERQLFILSKINYHLKRKACLPKR